MDWMDDGGVTALMDRMMGDGGYFDAEGQASQALEKLSEYIESVGGDPLHSGWRCEVVKRAGGKVAGKVKDTYYYAPSGQRFRSKREVAIYLALDVPVLTTKRSTPNELPRPSKRKTSRPSSFHDYDSTYSPLEGASHGANKSWKRRCRTILNSLMQHRFSWPFLAPVRRSDAPDYFDVIDAPMDLGTALARLEDDAYATPDEVAADVQLVFSNAMTYNPEGHQFHEMAATLKEVFDELWDSRFGEAAMARAAARRAGATAAAAAAAATPLGSDDDAGTAAGDAGYGYASAGEPGADADGDDDAAATGAAVNAPGFSANFDLLVSAALEGLDCADDSPAPAAASRLDSPAPATAGEGDAAGPTARCQEAEVREAEAREAEARAEVREAEAHASDGDGSMLASSAAAEHPPAAVGVAPEAADAGPPAVPAAGAAGEGVPQDAAVATGGEELARGRAAWCGPAAGLLRTPSPPPPAAAPPAPPAPATAAVLCGGCGQALPSQEGSDGDDGGGGGAAAAAQLAPARASSAQLAPLGCDERPAAAAGAGRCGSPAAARAAPHPAGGSADHAATRAASPACAGESRSSTGTHGQAVTDGLRVRVGRGADAAAADCAGDPATPRSRGSAPGGDEACGGQLLVPGGLLGPGSAAGWAALGGGVSCCTPPCFGGGAVGGGGGDAEAWLRQRHEQDLAALGFAHAQAAAEVRSTLSVRVAALELEMASARAAAQARLAELDRQRAAQEAALGQRLELGLAKVCSGTGSSSGTDDVARVVVGQ